MTISSKFDWARIERKAQQSARSMTSGRAKAILMDLFEKPEIKEVPGNPNLVGGFIFVSRLGTYMVMPSGMVINCQTGQPINDTTKP